MQAHAGGVDEDVRVRRNLRRALPGVELGLRGGVPADGLRQLLAARNVAVDDVQLLRTLQRALHADGLGCAARAQDRDHLARKRDVRVLQGAHEALAVGVFADQLAVPHGHGVHRADDARGLTQLVQVFKHRDLVGHGQVDSLHVHGAHALHGVRQLLHRHAAGEIAPVQPGGGEARFLNHARGVSVHGISEYADQLGAIVLLSHADSTPFVFSLTFGPGGRISV